MNRKNLVTRVGGGVLAASIVANGYLAYHSHSLSETLIEKEKVISGMKDTQQVQQAQIAKLDKNLLSVRQENTDLKVGLKDATKKLNKTAKKVTALKNGNAELKQNVTTLKREVKKLRSAQVKEPSRHATVQQEHTIQQASAPVSASRTLTMTATAYTASCAGCTGKTATGINIRSNPGAKVIAVDPRVIPLGSRLYVEGYGYAIAGDTGGAIKGHKIDVFIPNHSDAKSFGVRTVQVKVLD